MKDKMKTRSEKMQELIKLANTSEKDLAKMNYKEKQKVLKPKINYAVKCGILQMAHMLNQNPKL